MKRVLIPAIALIVSVLALSSPSLADELNSLRGDVKMTMTNPAADIHPIMENGRYPLNFRQQPPLIPHRIDKYQINLKVNQCMRCHNWQYAAKEGAPKISETHYKDHRTGLPLDDVAPGRWFCNQCHVPQMAVKPLVENTFNR